MQSVIGVRLIAATVAAGVLSACAADAVLGPHEDHATMRMEASGPAASSIGQTIALDAAVLRSDGEPLRGAEVHWEVSDARILRPIGDGRFEVLTEGTAQVVAIWPKDPSVRATVTVTVDAGLLAAACIVKADQGSTAASKCAEARVVVRFAPTASLSTAPAGDAAPTIAALTRGVR
jgi:hypothetical protein